MSSSNACYKSNSKVTSKSIRRRIKPEHCYSENPYVALLAMHQKHYGMAMKTRVICGKIRKSLKVWYLKWQPFSQQKSPVR